MLRLLLRLKHHYLLRLLLLLLLLRLLRLLQVLCPRGVGGSVQVQPRGVLLRREPLQRRGLLHLRREMLGVRRILRGGRRERAAQRVRQHREGGSLLLRHLQHDLCGGVRSECRRAGG